MISIVELITKIFLIILKVEYKQPIKGQFFRHGGSRDLRPTSAAFNTFWNIQITYKTMPIKTPFFLGRIKDGPYARLIGIIANIPIQFTYGPYPYIEGTNQKEISIPSLYEYQLKKR